MSKAAVSAELCRMISKFKENKNKHFENYKSHQIQPKYNIHTVYKLY